MGSDTDAVTRAWLEAKGRLPQGWQLEGLRRASTGLGEEDRTDDWIVAVGPAGEERVVRAADPVAALAGLAAAFR